MTATTPAVREGLVALACGHARTLPFEDARTAGARGGKMACYLCPPRRVWRCGTISAVTALSSIVTHRQLSDQGRCTVCLEQYDARGRCSCNRPWLELADLLEQWTERRGPTPGDPFDLDLWAHDTAGALARVFHRGQ